MSKLDELEQRLDRLQGAYSTWVEPGVYIRRQSFVDFKSRIENLANEVDEHYQTIIHDAEHRGFTLICRVQRLKILINK